MYPTTIPAKIVPIPTALSPPKNMNESINAITTFDVSNIIFIFGNGMSVTLHTASDTPSPGSTTAFEFTSKNTPNAITIHPSMHTIDCSNRLCGIMNAVCVCAKSMKYPNIVVVII